ncbi:MAG TPA: VOC family protein [Blastocatellia bacterium]|nr:VOC family protein [Blastocatellia bacterium]
MKQIFIALLCIVVGSVSKQSDKERAVLSRVDHLVYAAPNLTTAVEHVERILGVKSVVGGQHPGGGTRNALIGLGDETYLEIIGPDPEQPQPVRPRRFGIDDLKSPRLVTWAVKSTDLEATTEKAKTYGLDLGEVQSGSRRRPDGVLLAWRLTVSRTLTADGIVPFFIDWGNTQHPAKGLSKGCKLVSLRAEHPNAKAIEAGLSALGLNIRIDAGSAPALIATIQTPHGQVELR